MWVLVIFLNKTDMPSDVAYNIQVGYYIPLCYIAIYIILVGLYSLSCYICNYISRSAPGQLSCD